MRVLFDQGTPVPLKQHLPGYEIQTAHERGWSRLLNGDLIAVAEGRFDVLVTPTATCGISSRLPGEHSPC
jgi:hypothetical protein